MKINITGFFRDIFNFLKSGSALGIDIGTSSIKVVEISHKSNKFHLENYGLIEAKDYLRHPNLALQTSSLSISERETSRLLRILLREMNTKTKTAVISASISASFVTLFDMPLLSEKETAQSVGFQARQYIPMPISDVSVDWLRLERFTGEGGNEFQRILLIGIPKKTIVSLKNICKSSGLRLVAIELDGLALVRALSEFGVPTIVIDIGAQSTGIFVVEKGSLKQASQTDYSGINVTRAVSTSLDLSMLRAEELKKHRGLLGEAGESELSMLILPFLDVIIQEVEYIKGLYEKRYGKKVEQAVLIGGGAKRLGFDSYVADRLKLKIIPPDVFSNLDYPTIIEPAMGGLRRELPIAVGLAKKFFVS